MPPSLPPHRAHHAAFNTSASSSTARRESAEVRCPGWALKSLPLPAGRQLTWIMKPFSSSISQMHRTISLRASSSSWDSSKLVESKSWLYSSPLRSKLSVEESSRNSTSVKSRHTERDPQHSPISVGRDHAITYWASKGKQMLYSHTDVFLSLFLPLKFFLKEFKVHF